MIKQSYISLSTHKQTDHHNNIMQCIYKSCSFRQVMLLQDYKFKVQRLALTLRMSDKKKLNKYTVCMQTVAGSVNIQCGYLYNYYKRYF